MSTQRTFVLLSTIFYLLLLPTIIFAGGLQLEQQSASSLGNNTAGIVAIANDATTAYYNPAGLPRIQQQEMAFSIINQINSIKFDGQVSVDSGLIQGGKIIVLPILQYAAPISEKLGFGFNITQPSVSKIDYGQETFPNHLVTQTSFRTINIGTSLGYRLFKPLLLGISINAEHLNFELDRIDAPDLDKTGLNENKLSDWGWGFDTGILLEISSYTRIGLNYHSKITHNTSGRSRFYNYSNDEINKTLVKSKLVLPNSFTFSIYHDFKNQFSLLGSINYTKWRSLKNFYLKNVATADSPVNIDIQGYVKNTWQFSVGINYKIDPNTILRIGTGYDQTPIPYPFCHLILPDAKRYIVSFGIGHQFTDTLGLDIGYSHAFMPRVDIHHNQSINTQDIMTTGQLHLNEDILGVQINWKMT